MKKQLDINGAFPGEVQVINGRKVRFQPPLFVDYVIPNGFLTQDIACHALFYYNQVAMNALNRVKHGVELEGETTLTPDFQQLFSSIARIYGLRGEHLIPFWPAVDMQCVALNLPALPKEGRYRFDDVARC